MTITRDDLQHDNSVDISVQVVSQQAAAKPKRAYRVIVKDINGDEIPVVVWEKHRTIVESFSVGEEVRLVDFRAKVWSSQTPTLHTVSRSTVEPTQSEATRILHISDSHLGYHLRPESGGKIMLWDNEIDCRLRFRNAIAAASKRHVDAIVHTGDIFDHDANEKDYELLESGVELLDSKGIPFFYILGNHETDEGKIRLQNLTNAELAFPLERVLGGYAVGNVRIYGIDNRPSDWWNTPDIFFTPTNARYSVACFHQTVSPLYSKGNPHCTIDTILDTVTSRIHPDLLLLGDLHRPLCDPDAPIPAYYAGPTARISSHYKTAEPQANLFEFDGSPSHYTIPL